MSYQWNLEELVEDVFVAYLKAKCSGELSVYAAFAVEVQKYPAVIVHAGESDMVAKGARWHNPREMAVDIAVISEACDKIDASAGVTETARERNAKARSDVMNALAILDSATAPSGLSALCQPEDMPHGLAAELDAMQIPGVWICSAVPAKMTRTAEGGDKGRIFTTTISVLVIAQPVAIGGEPT